MCQGFVWPQHYWLYSPIVNGLVLSKFNTIARYWINKICVKAFMPQHYWFYRPIVNGFVLNKSNTHILIEDIGLISSAYITT